MNNINTSFFNKNLYKSHIANAAKDGSKGDDELTDYDIVQQTIDARRDGGRIETDAFNPDTRIAEISDLINNRGPKGNASKSSSSSRTSAADIHALLNNTDGKSAQVPTVQEWNADDSGEGPIFINESDLFASAEAPSDSYTNNNFLEDKTNLDTSLSATKSGSGREALARAEEVSPLNEESILNGLRDRIFGRINFRHNLAEPWSGRIATFETRTEKQGKLNIRLTWKHSELFIGEVFQKTRSKPQGEWKPIKLISAKLFERLPERERLVLAENGRLAPRYYTFLQDEDTKFNRRFYVCRV